MSAQVAIVAGAGGEPGRATTMALAAGGRSVVAVDRSERGLLDLPSGIAKASLIPVAVDWLASDP